MRGVRRGLRVAAVGVPVALVVAVVVVVVLGSRGFFYDRSLEAVPGVVEAGAVDEWTDRALLDPGLSADEVAVTMDELYEASGGRFLAVGVDGAGTAASGLPRTWVTPSFFASGVYESGPRNAASAAVFVLLRELAADDAIVSGHGFAVRDGWALRVGVDTGAASDPTAALVEAAAAITRAAEQEPDDPVVRLELTDPDRGSGEVETLAVLACRSDDAGRQGIGALAGATSQLADTGGDAPALLSC